MCEKAEYFISDYVCSPFGAVVPEKDLKGPAVGKPAPWQQPKAAETTCPVFLNGRWEVTG
jgi:hypothetical protein